jgi:hypothetical protein
MVSTTIKFMLGLYPNAETLEQNNLALAKEYSELQEFLKSDTLARYEYLMEFVKTKEFNDKRDHYLSLIFKGSPEEKKELEYLSQKKSKDVIFYYKYKSSPAYSLFLKMDGSKTIQEYEHLKAFIDSAQYKKVEEYMKDKKKFEKTQEFQKFQEYIELSKNPSFINYFKFIQDKGYNDFKNLYKSAKVTEFEALEKYILSNEFVTRKNSAKKNEFKNSEDYRKFLEYKQLKKSSEIRNYYKLVNSPLLGDYKKLNQSEELNFFNELKAFVQSPAYINKKKEIESLRFESTDEYAKFQEYNNQSKSSEIKGYYKAKASKELSEFKRIEGSKIIPDYEKLEQYIQSEEFKTRKLYLLDTKKWEKTEEFKLFAELEALKKDPKIIWYLKVKDSNKFDPIKAWSLIFEDDFTSGKVDKSKWITKYFWGEVLLNDTYALPGEKHLFNEDKNIQYNGSSLKIVTKKEKITGKEWNPLLGFYPREFDFTSAIINSGSSFRTKYGKIEAKIKVNPSKGILHAFWLAGETMVPQIDIFKCVNNKLYFSTFWGNPLQSDSVKNDTTSISSGFLKEKYVIYTLEWSPESIIWKINNLVVKTQNNNIPDGEMFVAVNSGVLADDADVTSANLEIDWVRCYQKN